MGSIDITKEVKNELMYKVLSFVFGTLLVLIFIKDRQVVKLALGILLLFLSTYDKKVYACNDGIIYTYKALLFKRKESINFKDIDEITVVRQNNNCIVFIIKEPMARKLIVDEEKLSHMVEFIKNVSQVPIRFETIN